MRLLRLVCLIFKRLMRCEVSTRQRQTATVARYFLLMGQCAPPPTHTPPSLRSSLNFNIMLCKEKEKVHTVDLLFLNTDCSKMFYDFMILHCAAFSTFSTKKSNSRTDTVM